MNLIKRRSIIMLRTDEAVYQVIFTIKKSTMLNVILPVTESPWNKVERIARIPSAIIGEKSKLPKQNFLLFEKRFKYGSQIFERKIVKPFVKPGIQVSTILTVQRSEYTVTTDASVENNEEGVINNLQFN